jgi:hypothetical protein
LIRRFQSMDRKWIFFVIGAILFTPVMFAQNGGFEFLASEFEIRLNAAAESWKNGESSMALDGFNQAREWISRAPIQYSDAFAWSGCRTLMTYSIVLARLVETEAEQRKGSNLAGQIKSQAKQWAEILSKQSEAWSKIDPMTTQQAELRIRWTKRFLSVINKTRNASSSE